jgi:hypothetical protein
MGGRAQTWRVVVLVSCAVPLNEISCPPWIRGILHRNSSGGVNRVLKCLLPHNDVFFRNIFRFPCLDFAVNAGCIQRCWYAKNHASGGELVSKIRLQDDKICDLCRSNLIDGRNHAQR